MLPCPMRAFLRGPWWKMTEVGAKRTAAGAYEVLPWLQWVIW
jgi:hypothetical protein